MPDICDLILDEHEMFRRRFAELDEHRDAAADRLRQLWEPIAADLDRHAEAEEAVFYPSLLQHGIAAEDETKDAIGDHNDIRDAVHEARNHETGSTDWWTAVASARESNSDHLAEEERGALADFRARTTKQLREDLGARFLAYNTAHDGGRVSGADKEPNTYIEHHTGR